MPTQNACAAPTLNAALAGNAEATLDWSAVSGAIGYRVRYGTSAGDYTTSITVGNVTTLYGAGLTNGQTYYFAVDACNTIGDSLPSNALQCSAAQPRRGRHSGDLELQPAMWVTRPVRQSLRLLLLSVSSLTRGAGLLNDGEHGPDRQHLRQWCQRLRLRSNLAASISRQPVLPVHHHAQ